MNGIRIVVVRELATFPEAINWVTSIPENATQDINRYIIENCVDVWNLEKTSGSEDATEDYSLRFKDPKNLKDILVTEENKDLVTTTRGVVLKLCYSNKRTVHDIVESLEDYGHAGFDILLHRLGHNGANRDEDFFLCFTQDFNGVSVTLKRLLYEIETHSDDSKTINFLLESICLMIDIGQEKVIKTIEKDENGIKIVNFLASSGKYGIITPRERRISNAYESKGSSSAPMKHLSKAAEFLTLIQRSEDLSAMIREMIQIPDLINLVMNKDLDPNVTLATLALLNELLLNDSDRMRHIEILESAKLPLVLGKMFPPDSVHLTPIFKSHLYYIQCWTLMKYKTNMNFLVDSQNQEAVKMIKDLRKIAFENAEGAPPGSMGTLQKNRFAEDYKTLGFKNHVDPTQDFQTSPGFLSLSLMHNYATENSKQFIELVFSFNDCPFAMASIGLVKLLCKAFRIDSDPKYITKPSEHFYHFILLRDGDFLQEIFNICIQHMFKTWKDMRASLRDYNIVIDVTEHQILYALNHHPNTIDEFKAKLPSYSTINTDLQKGKEREGEFLEKPAIKGLVDYIKPTIMNLIERQRLNYITNGTLFTKQKKIPGTTKTIFVRLSPNKKTICYGDWKNDNTIPDIDQLPGKMAISGFLTGDECIMYRDSNKEQKQTQKEINRFITILSDDHSSNLELIAPEENSSKGGNQNKTFEYWCDALNHLLGKEMTSSKKHEDEKMLLMHEIELRLLDIEDIIDELPEAEPPIPPLPDLASLGIQQC